MPDFLAKFLQGFRFHGCMVSEREMRRSSSKLLKSLCISAALTVGLPVAASWAETPSTAFTQSLATAAAEDAAIAEWYRETGYEPLWTGADDAARRTAFLTAILAAPDHGLPVARYDAVALMSAIRGAESEGDRGRVELMLTRAYLAWAHDLTSGVLDPSKVDKGIVREIAVIDPKTLLARISAGNPEAVLDWLLPEGQAYLNLMKAKIGLESQIAAGGWGAPVDAGRLEPGATGPEVVALRDRLVVMGYLGATSTATYDKAIEAAVVAFQADHGLTADGIFAEATRDELNVPADERLKSVLVALERERWLHFDRSAEMVWVNLPDFHAKILDKGRVVFDTRVVIGKASGNTQSPEFSDVMEHMVVNPSWGVPRSIIVGEYLPQLQQNPNAAGHLRIIDSRGRVVDRASVDFTAYNASNFPFDMMQPPSDGNALGKVKFMFPNPYNIYLHDTPSKSLFDKEVRAFSHGCIRVARPFDLAYFLLGRQSSDPEGEFQGYIDTGKETTVRLETPLPVHLVYFTAYPDAKGKITYRRDIYGRDAKLYDALVAAGVVMPGLQG